MAQNFLCLNDDKTEVVLFASPYFQKRINIPHVSIGNDQIYPTVEAKNIGFIFDNVMNGKKQISAICKAGWFHIRNIGNMRRYLDKSSTERLIHAYISSKLDVNNALLYGLPDYLIKKLQRLQNAAARMVMQAPKHCHITPILKDLHWLSIRSRMHFKVLLTVYKALHGLAPIYISDLLVRRQSSYRSTRSCEGNMLIVPPTKDMTVTWGERNFIYVGPYLWNQLPANIRNCVTLDSFKTRLKTCLFRDAFELDN